MMGCWIHPSFSNISVLDYESTPLRKLWTDLLRPRFQRFSDGLPRDPEKKRKEDTNLYPNFSSAKSWSWISIEIQNLAPTKTEGHEEKRMRNENECKNCQNKLQRTSWIFQIWKGGEMRVRFRCRDTDSCSLYRRSRFVWPCLIDSLMINLWIGLISIELLLFWNNTRSITRTSRLHSWICQRWMFHWIRCATSVRIFLHVEMLSPNSARLQTISESSSHGKIHFSRNTDEHFRSRQVCLCFFAANRLGTFLCEATRPELFGVWNTSQFASEAPGPSKWAEFWRRRGGFAPERSAFMLPSNPSVSVLELSCRCVVPIISALTATRQLRRKPDRNSISVCSRVQIVYPHYWKAPKVFQLCVENRNLMKEIVHTYFEGRKNLDRPFVVKSRWLWEPLLCQCLVILKFGYNSIQISQAANLLFVIWSTSKQIVSWSLMNHWEKLGERIGALKTSNSAFGIKFQTLRELLRDCLDVARWARHLRIRVYSVFLMT